MHRFAVHLLSVHCSTMRWSISNYFIDKNGFSKIIRGPSPFLTFYLPVRWIFHSPSWFRPWIINVTQIPHIIYLFVVHSLAYLKTFRFSNFLFQFHFTSTRCIFCHNLYPSKHYIARVRVLVIAVNKTTLPILFQSYYVILDGIARRFIWLWRPF